MLTRTEPAACHGSQGIVPNVAKHYFMSDQSPCYMAFLLRLWCIPEKDGVAWRASLEDAHTGERRGFADVSRLLAFLLGRTQNVTSDEMHKAISGDEDSS